MLGALSGKAAGRPPLRDATASASSSVSHVVQRDLWGYPETAVRAIEVDSFRLLHRASFAHRNVRTYVVVVYVPGSTTCADAEAEVERLASGLTHETRVLVGSINAIGSKDAFEFCTSVLEAKAYPTVYLYPEGSPGFMRFTGERVTAEGMLSALNGARSRVFGDARTPLSLSPPTAAAAYATAASPAPAAAATASGASSLRPSDVKRQQGDTRQRQVLTQLDQAGAVYWARPGKTAFWGFVVVFGLAALWWDRWGEDWWAWWQLRDRQQRRAKGEVFDDDTTGEDLMQLSLMGARLKGDDVRARLNAESPGMADAAAAAAAEEADKAQRGGSGGSGSGGGGGGGGGSSNGVPISQAGQGSQEVVDVEGQVVEEEQGGRGGPAR
ncbi:hypothetical protein FOA52_010882 [Chlamydomonas sp. UWO 241]|nr:hypothetical protein FOA52_010882 [Chlamydomonas sp. UWO 241]